MVKFCILASSSSGNCYFLSTGKKRILIDAGLSKRETMLRLAAIGEANVPIDAILITHEHTDHVCGLLPIAKEFGAPVFISRLTAPAIAWGDYQPNIELFQAGSSFSIGDIDVDSFTIPHDAVDPVGFAFRSQGVKLAVATDLGYMTDSIRFHLRNSNFVLLESNHDLDMLKVGPYPWSVKQRVMSRMGHLSNEAACEFLKKDLDTSVDRVVLGHLSENNNHPAIVEVMASQALASRALFTTFSVAEPGKQSVVFDY